MQINNMLTIVFCLVLVNVVFGQERAAKPNIVVIVADDHGMKDMGCYGNKAIKTPNLDYLASEGTRFTRAYSTTPSCAASRSVILSGLHNHSNGMYGHEHSYNHFRSYEFLKSLPVYLEELAGYHTVRIGKYHVGPDSVYRFQTTLRDSQPRNPVHMAEVAGGHLSTIDKETPFFLYFCTYDPHRSGGVVEGNPYKPNRFGNRDEGVEGVEEFEISPEEVEVPWYLPDLPETRAELVQYYKSVNRVDQGVGRLIALLKEQDRWDNTIILYLSDNGIAFQGAKTNLYEPGVNLPFILKDTKSKNKGNVSDAMVSWADITPTLLDFAGVYKEAERDLATRFEGQISIQTRATGFHGESIKPLVEGKKDAVHDELLLSHTFHEITMYYPMRVIYKGDYKLIFNIANALPFPHAADLWKSATWQAALKSEAQTYGGKAIDAYTYRPRFELYNLRTDPQESNNLATEKKYRSVLEGMKEGLKALQKKYNDPWYIKWEHE